MSAFNGSGTFVITGTGLPYITGTTISSTVGNQLNTDLATGLSTCITKNGQTTPTANIPMAGFKITGLAVGTTLGDALSYGRPGTMAGVASTAGVVDNSVVGVIQTSFNVSTTFLASSISMASASPVFLSVIPRTAGVSLSDGGTSWGSLSDETMKTAFTPFEKPLARIAQIKTGTGRFLDDPEDVSRSFLSAQSLQAVLPEAVKLKECGEGEPAHKWDGKLLATPIDVIPLLIAALAEAKARIETLEQKL